MIDIKMYGAPKVGNGVTTNSILMMGGGGELEPHYIWGQKFDGTQDVNGDMKVNGTAYIDYSYMIRLDSTYINCAYTNTAYLGANTAEINYLKSRQIDADYAAILKAFIGEMSATAITTENLTVTKSAHFFELVVDKIKAAGGAVLFTPANGFTIRKYDKIKDAYRLYFLANERGSAIRNMWQIGDQAICQSFNNANSGQNYDVSNKYWWSVVINTNNDDNQGNPVNINVGTSENIDMQWCHYIDISDTIFDGELNISVDDDVAMLGYRGEDDPARQNAIYISCYSSLDTEIKAPLICQYKGINDFNLASHKYTWFSGGVTPEGIANSREANEIRGSIKLQDGKTLDDTVSYMYSYLGQFKVSSDEILSEVSYIYSYIDAVGNQVNQKVSWSYILQHSDEINLNVVNGLKETGIDIKTGEIVINSDNTTFMGNITMTNKGDGITLYDENNKPKTIISRDKLERKYVTDHYEYLPSQQAQTKTRNLDTKPYLLLGDYYTETKAEFKSKYLNDIKGIYIGNYTTSDSIKITLNHNIRFCHKDYDKGVYDVPGWSGYDTGQYKFVYKVYTGDGTTVVNETTITLNGSTTQEIQVTCPSNSDYYLDWKIDYTYDAQKVTNGMTYYTIGEYMWIRVTESAQGMTFIGLNGIYSSNNSDRYMVYSEEGFNIVEKSPRTIQIGDSSHTIQNPKYQLAVDPELGPYWGYENLGGSWAVPIGVPKLTTIYPNDFTDVTIKNESGQDITVKGYNVNCNIYNMIRIYGQYDSNDYYIILPYIEPSSVMIYNYSSNKNIYIYARNPNGTKNIYMNKRHLGNHNTGQWRYELGQTDEMLWMMSDRYGWNNVSLIDH